MLALPVSNNIEEDPGMTVLGDSQLSDVEYLSDTEESAISSAKVCIASSLYLVTSTDVLHESHLSFQSLSRKRSSPQNAQPNLH